MEAKMQIPETCRGWKVEAKHYDVVFYDADMNQIATITTRHQFITMIGQSNLWTAQEARKKAIDMLSIAEFIDQYMTAKGV